MLDLRPGHGALYERHFRFDLTHAPHYAHAKMLQQRMISHCTAEVWRDVRYQHTTIFQPTSFRLPTTGVLELTCAPATDPERTLNGPSTDPERTMNGP